MSRVFPQVDQPEACTTVVLSRYGGGMFGYLLDLARDGEPSAWAEGSIAGRSAEVRVAGVGDRELVVRLAGEALVLSRG